MSDPKHKWNQPAAPPGPMFFGKKERDLVKQVNDELAERIIGQPIAYYPISAEESNFNETYGEAVEKVSLPPIRVYAFVVVENEQSNEKFGYEYQTKLTVNFHRRRLVEDQNLYVRVGDFVQYGDEFYEIVRLYNDTRFLFGQVEHKFQVTADCIRARQGVFKVMPGLEREKEFDVASGAETPRTAPFPPIAASYITVNAEAKLPNERVLTAGTGIEFDDTGPNGTLTLTATSTSTSAEGVQGNIQFHGSSTGSFAANSTLTYITASGYLGIGTDTPTHELTVIGDISASANVLIGGDLTVKDLTVSGIAGGGSPFKVRDSIAVYNDADQIVARLGSSSFGDNSLSASFGGFNNLSASANVSASYFYGDGSNLTGVTASAVEVADGPIGSLQFKEDAAGEISGSGNVLYNIANNYLTVDSGLIHARTAIITSHTASASEYFLAVTGVPTEIEFNATLFAEGQVLVVKDESGAASSGNPITLNASASQTMDGESTAYIESPYGSVLLYSNGINWFIY
jgi:hypothetical protein